MRGSNAVGCVIVWPRPRVFFDDLCLAHPSEWPSVGRALLDAPIYGPALLCAPTKDTLQQTWLHSQSQWVAASYSLSIALTPSTIPVPHPEVIVTGRLPVAPIHPFGESIDPTKVGGLRIMSDHGMVIGDAPVEPPIFDPGGPTTVIDRIVGPNRGALVSEAIAAASARGDAQLIVVADVHDDELIELAEVAGATCPVVNWTRQ